MDRTSLKRLVVMVVIVLGTATALLIAHEYQQREAQPSLQWWMRGAQWGLLVAAALAVLLAVRGTFALVRALRRRSERARNAELASSRPGYEGTTSLRREPCDVAMLVDRAIRQLRDEARERGVRLRFESQLSMSVFADRQRVVHALTTLVGVAIQTSPVGAEIVLTAAPCNDTVRFAITDGGVTTPLPETFQPAVAAVPDELALQLTQRVIEAHGGRMGIEAVTAGRTYWFALPTEPSVLR